jgi:hypothetical protein
MLIILTVIVTFAFIHFFIPNFFISIFESFGSFLILLLVSSFGGYFISIIFTTLGFPYDVFWYAMAIVGYLFYKDVKNNE